MQDMYTTRDVMGRDVGSVGKADANATAAVLLGTVTCTAINKIYNLRFQSGSTALPENINRRKIKSFR